ncbi:hypothetical protein [Bradyrhizobium sp. CIR3A]|uniref:hypothetical protein n=1 Tax=Bradyrhizobium sp. CIR3A TaxID=2663838 RepID=UPI001605F76F|nr:hypothetical protein [Bradyrhizobium sp. CIR3A]MBB4258773.1 hypothetical protein [Bradyrhizobium sp. CIR3A]
MGTGSDRIVFGAGSGDDVLDNPGSGYQRNDVLDLKELFPSASRCRGQNITPSAVQLTRSGSDMTLVIAESTPGAGGRAPEVLGPTNLGNIWY